MIVCQVSLIVICSLLSMVLVFLLLTIFASIN
uniref:Uncharacterized protein n=1 Tax=Siphoviridae sp. cteEQ43 TaxID=2827905 RepID=A0A8S5TCB5_9CAUD|nr:MAG TPA: hypothetical protein [Siphoviridae sp. cteEQ43]